MKNHVVTVLGVPEAAVASLSVVDNDGDEVLHLDVRVGIDTGSTGSPYRDVGRTS